MVTEYQQTIERIRHKAELIIQRYNILLQEKRNSEVKISELEELILRQKKEIEQLQLENEYLKVATTIVPDRNKVEQSRALLSELVREIDKCILELKE